MNVPRNLSLFEPESDRSSIFLNIENTIKYLLDKNYISDSKQCSKCDNLMLIESYKKNINNYAYKCKNRECRTVCSLFEGKRIFYPEVTLDKHLLAIFKWLENNYEKDVLRNLNFGKKMVQKIKKNIQSFLAEEYDETSPLEGRSGWYK